ncbi:unnamed protein product [Absidia cylindrospora]
MDTLTSRQPSTRHRIASASKSLVNILDILDSGANCSTKGLSHWRNMCGPTSPIFHPIHTISQMPLLQHFTSPSHIIRSIISVPVHTALDFPTKLIKIFWRCPMYPQARTIFYRSRTKRIPYNALLHIFGTLSSPRCSIRHVISWIHTQHSVPYTSRPRHHQHSAIPQCHHPNSWQIWNLH